MTSIEDLRKFGKSYFEEERRIQFPRGARRRKFPRGARRSQFPIGTRRREFPTGTRSKSRFKLEEQISSTISSI
ncbi:hypothetical protein C0J52_18552 [Blattella germanica]|nr:hypothetical protein C0J52_18552 [Blattella germanica]